MNNPSLVTESVDKKTDLIAQQNERKKARTKKRWKQSDLVVLKREFNNGTRLKVIAKILNRTETSINKELSRSGIRLRRIKKGEQLIIEKVNSDNKQSDNLLIVIDYLKTKDYNIARDKPNENNCKNAFYRLNNKPMSATRLLVIANKHRLEDGLPVFRIKEPEN